MNETDTDDTNGRTAGVPVELWNKKKRKLNDLLTDLTDLECVVSADGRVKCSSTGTARIRGEVVLDCREVWGDFTLLFSRHADIDVAGLSSKQKLVPTDHGDRMETTTRVTVTFVESAT